MRVSTMTGKHIHETIYKQRRVVDSLAEAVAELDGSSDLALARGILQERLVTEKQILQKLLDTPYTPIPAKEFFI